MAGPGELGNLLKQAQKMQKEMDLAREDVSKMIIEGTAGGAAARAVVDGNGSVQSIHLSAEALESGDAGELEALVLAALKDAQTRAEQQRRERLSAVTGGMDLPGLF